MDPSYLGDFQGETSKYLDENKIDLGFNTERKLKPGYSITIPILTFDHFVLTKKTVAGVSGFRQVFAPFSPALWGMIGLSVVYGAVIMHALAFLQNSLSKSSFKSFVAQFPQFVYHTLAAMLGGDEYEYLGSGSQVDTCTHCNTLHLTIFHI